MLFPDRDGAGTMQAHRPDPSRMDHLLSFAI